MLISSDPIPPASHLASAFGLLWRSDIALSGFDTVDDGGDRAGDIDVYRVNRLADRPAGRAVDRGFVYADGIRFCWDEEVIFDISASTIAYKPDRDWTGVMPVSFYSTVAALIAAWRGLVPLHASAVAIDGRAVLVVGRSGAGKSTLTAGLLALGARFIADDLVVLSVGRHRIDVQRGRPTIRLHPDTAGPVDPHAAPVLGDPLGKWLARPDDRQREALALGAVVILDAADVAPAAQLLPHLFRRRRMAALPMRDMLIQDILAIASRVPVLAYPAQTDSSAPARRNRAEEVMNCVRATMTRAHNVQQDPRDR